MIFHHYRWTDKLISVNNYHLLKEPRPVPGTLTLFMRSSFLNVLLIPSQETSSAFNVNHISECHIDPHPGSRADAAFGQRMIPKLVGRRVHQQQASRLQFKLDRRRRRRRGGDRFL